MITHKKRYSPAERDGILRCCLELERLARKMARLHPDHDANHFFTSIHALALAVSAAVTGDDRFTVYVTTQDHLPFGEWSDEDYGRFE